MWTDVSSSLPHKIMRDAPFPEPSCICLSKSPSKPRPSRFPNRGPMERVARLHDLILHVSQFPHKHSPNKRKFSLLSLALGKECPSMFPKNGALMEADAHFQSLI